MKTILLSGGSGFIGSHFCRAATARGWQLIVITRDTARAAKRLPAQTALIESLDQLDSHPPVDVLINLAGQSLADGRWSERRKQQIIHSRIGTTQVLFQHFKHHPETAPKVVISGSAIGYYGGGRGEDLEVAEDGAKVNNFSHQLCAAWENSAKPFVTLGSRVCLLRTGIVLGEQGALSKMLPAFKIGFGGPMGDGGQWMPWIHIEDMVEIIMYCIEQKQLQGPVNATAPQPSTNRDFAVTLGTVLNRPSALTMPAAVVKLLFGQMGDELLLQGQRVVPKKLQDFGFEFLYDDLAIALTNLLKK